MFHRGLGQNAMAQIKNMTGSGAGAAQDFSDPVFDFLRRCIERDRIEISLDGDIIADGFPGFVKINAPVEPNHRAADGVRQPAQLSKSCTASAPAAIWQFKYSEVSFVSRSIRRFHASGAV